MGQAVVGDTIAEHAAQLVARLIDGDVVAHDREVVRAREARGATAHHSHALAGLFGHVGTVVRLHVVHGIALEAADVHGVVHHAAPAVHLAGMLADIATDQGQRVVLADEADGVRVAARLHQADVAGDVHARRAAGDAGHELALREAAGVLLDVVLEVITEAADGGERHVAGLVANCAVGREVDCARRALDKVERVLVRAVLQDVVQKVRERAQANAAGRALAAALRGAHVYVRRGELHRAGGERAYRKAPTKRLVQVVHDSLGLATLHHMKPSHKVLSLSWSPGLGPHPGRRITFQVSQLTEPRQPSIRKR